MAEAEREVQEASKAVILNLWVAKPLVVVGCLVPNDPFAGVPQNHQKTQISTPRLVTVVKLQL